MFRFNFNFFWLLFIISHVVQAQDHVVVHGYVTDQNSGEKLINANIYLQDQSYGTVSNNYGFYTLNLPKGRSTLTCSYVGYEQTRYKLRITKDTVINFSLIPGNELEEVVIKDYEAAKSISKVTIPVSYVKEMPLIGGEEDVIKLVKYLPGVQGGIEGTSNLSVRGGSHDQNLILLDGVPVYNVNHLFGLFSVFNSNAIKSTTFYKGGFPARFGGRVSSILDIRLKEGNNKSLDGEFSVGLISSQALIEGPIVKDKTSFLLSARRTYFDVLSYPYTKWIRQDGVYNFNFYDVNAKLNHQFNANNNLIVSFYSGRDNYLYKYKDRYDNEDGSKETDKGKDGLKWGNITSSIRWNHSINKRLFANVTAYYSRFSFVALEEWNNKVEKENETIEEEFSSRRVSSLNDYSINAELEHAVSNNHNLHYGFSSTLHEFKPELDAYFLSRIRVGANVDTLFGGERLLSQENNLYAEDEVKINDNLDFNVGLRFTNYNLVESTKSYNVFEPRLNLNQIINDQINLNVSYSRTYQFVHLLSRTSIGFPNDQWVPITGKVKPIQAHQFALGAQYTLGKDYKFSLEGYYKQMKNLLEYKEGADLIGDWQKNVEQGNGTSCGAEILLEKPLGKLYGWISYTLSKTTRQFEEINGGQPFPYKYDRRHNLKITAVYDWKDNISLGINWIYTSGSHATLPQESFHSVAEIYSEDYFQYYYTFDAFENHKHRNNFTLPAYHRLDLGVNFKKKKRKHLRTIRVGVYNAYNRLNATYLTISNGSINKTSYFPVIPYIRYKIKY